METILGVSVPEDQKVEEAVSERKTAQERRESEFDRFITEKQINISVMNASEAVELIMKELSNKNSEYLDKKIWSITDTHIKDFYSKYRKDRGYKTNRGRPRGR